MVIDSSNDNTCSICLNELAGNGLEHTCSNGHIFHHKCLQKWMHHSNRCPTCRTEITDIIVPPKAKCRIYGEPPVITRTSRVIALLLSLDNIEQFLI